MTRCNGLRYPPIICHFLQLLGLILSSLFLVSWYTAPSLIVAIDSSVAGEWEYHITIGKIIETGFLRWKHVALLAVFGKEPNWIFLVVSWKPYTTIKIVFIACVSNLWNNSENSLVSKTQWYWKSIYFSFPKFFYSTF